MLQHRPSTVFDSFTNTDPLLSPGNHPCFSCKAVGREVTRCSVSGCGCYYHEDCVQKLPGTTSGPGGGFCCPQHICSTCCLERDLQRASKGKIGWFVLQQLSLQELKKNLLRKTKTFHVILDFTEFNQ